MIKLRFDELVEIRCSNCGREIEKKNSIFCLNCYNENLRNKGNKTIRKKIFL